MQYDGERPITSLFTNIHAIYEINVLLYQLYRSNLLPPKNNYTA